MIGEPGTPFSTAWGAAPDLFDVVTLASLANVHDSSLVLSAIRKLTNGDRSRICKSMRVCAILFVCLGTNFGRCARRTKSESKINGRTRGRLLEGTEWKSLERLRQPRGNWEFFCREWARSARRLWPA